MEEQINPLLSIAIATKNREYYCIEVIKSILKIDSNEIELVVSDNSNSTIIGDYVSSINDLRVKYIHVITPISFIQNFNNCIEITTGEYICLIGDDDGIFPEIIDKTKWAKANEIDSFCCQNLAAYYWPNSINDYPSGALILNKTEQFEPKCVSLQDELIRLLKNGLQHYLLFNLPKLYHGVVKREIFIKIKEKCGHYLGGLSPDIYSAISIGFICKKHYIIDTPLTIAGVCSDSSSAKNLIGKHSGRFEDIPHLKFKDNYIWSDYVPRYYSVNTIWAETGIKAFEDLEQNELIIKYYNPYRMMAQGFINNYFFIRPIMIQKMNEYRNHYKTPKLIFLYKIIINLLKIIINKLHSIIRKKRTIIIQNIKDIHQAIDVIKTIKY